MPSSKGLSQEGGNIILVTVLTTEEVMAFGGKRSLLHGTPPTVTAVTPVNQTKFLAGGDVLTITGTLFAATSTISIGGTSCYAAGGTSVTFTSAISISSTPPTSTLVSPTTQLPAGGNPLTITGTAFVGSTATVGGTDCPIVTVAATSITCKSPAMDGGIYAVVVTNADSGFSEAMNVVVTYQSVAATPPVVTAVTPIYQTKLLAGGDILTITGTSPTVSAASPIIQPKHVLGGDKLTIKGTFFAAGATVSVRGTTCPNVSDTSITCIAPAKPEGSYAVVVTNLDTGVSTSVKVIYAEYTGIPSVITAVSPIIQTKFLAGGDNLTITGSLFAAGATVMIGETACNNMIFVSATTLYCIAPAKPAGGHAVVVTNTDTGFNMAMTVVVTYVP
eukprot:gene22677-29830_t